MQGVQECKVHKSVYVCIQTAGIRQYTIIFIRKLIEILYFFLCLIPMFTINYRCKKKTQLGF